MRKKKKDNILTIKTDNDKLVGEMITKAERGDFYSAFVCYSRIDDDKKYLALPFVSGMYSKFNAVNYEVNSLLKLLATPKFKDYNPQALLYRVYNFFNSFMGLEVYEYYEKLLKKNFKNTPQALLLEGETKTNLPFEHLRLVDDGGKFYYEQALICLRAEKLAEANKWLEKIKPKSDYFTRAKNMQSIISLMMGDLDTAERVCTEAINCGGDNSEALASLMQIAKINPDRKTEIYDKIIAAKPCGKLSAKLVVADCYLERGEVDKAIETLEQVASDSRYEEAFLDKISNAYLVLGNKEMAEKYLKILVSIYDHNFRARYLLKNISSNKSVMTQSMLTPGKLKAEINKFFSLSSEEFYALTTKDLLYYFCIAKFYAGAERFKQLCLVYLSAPKSTAVLMDGLIDVETSEKYRQILLSTIIQAGVKGKFYCLVIGKLTEIEIDYPKTLYNEYIMSEVNLSNIDEKLIKDITFITHLINCFSQAFTLCLYSGLNTKQFGQVSEALSKKLLLLPDDGREKFSSIDACVFAFCYAFNKEFITAKYDGLFADISHETRAEVASIVDYDY